MKILLDDIFEIIFTFSFHTPATNQNISQPHQLNLCSSSSLKKKKRLVQQPNYKYWLTAHYFIKVISSDTIANKCSHLSQFILHFLNQYYFSIQTLATNVIMFIVSRLFALDKFCIYHYFLFSYFISFLFNIASTIFTAIFFICIISLCYITIVFLF